MRASIVLTAIAFLLGTAAASHAAKLSSAAIYGSIAQRQAGCTIGNGGPTPVSVDAHIYDESGNIVPASSSCNGPVEAGFICQVFANIANGVAYACSVDIAGSAKFIRANLTLRDANEVPVRSIDLR
ncbi:MAG TPA: hypothetical protein VFD92_24580 [Candidatus Binatia bacterium]|nr:hypothetical protein [Candidatus Binatia bacterium]